MWKSFLILSIFLSVAWTDESVNPCDVLTGNQTFAPNPRGCEMYFYCGDNNIPKSGRCPSHPINFYFNFETQSCELPENVECTINDELWNPQCPGIGIAKIPHTYSCSEYSVCLDNEPVDRSCPDGLHFSPYDQECVDPGIANCKNDAITCQGSDPFVPKFLPNSRNCRTYYLCFNNNLHLINCGPNQVYDQNTQTCVPAGTVECNETLNPDLEVPNSLTYDCSNVNNGSRIPHQENCKFWFWCINGRSQLFWCGKNAKFDSVTRLCAENSEAVCYDVNGQNKMEIEYQVMPAIANDTPLSIIMPKLNTIHKKDNTNEGQSKVYDEKEEIINEKFIGLF